MAEVERLGAVDPRAQAQLLEELRQSDPSLWPLAVKSVWSRVDYAQRFQTQQQEAQLADRRSRHGGRDHKDVNPQANYPTYPDASAYPGTPASPYPTTGATGQMSTADHETMKRLGEGGAYPAENSNILRPYNGQIERTLAPTNSSPSSGNNVLRPSTDAGAALKAIDAHDAVALKSPADGGVIQASYIAEEQKNADHAETSERKAPAGVKASLTADWKERLDEAIAALESQLETAAAGKTNSGTEQANVAGATATPSPAADHARLRIMRLLAGRRDDALAEMPLDDAAVRDFWSKEIFGLDVLLAAQKTAQEGNRAAEAKRHLSEAVLSLGEAATLEVRNLAFCSEVQSYGAIKRFEKTEFAPGQRLILYAEVENFRSENMPKGYHSSLRSSFQIYDAEGRRVHERESTTTEEYCLSPRRDYFIGCDFTLPANIYPGRHTLKLTVEDLKSRKVGESSIEFTIVKR